MHPEDMAARDEIARESFRTQEPTIYCYRLRNAAGQWVWVVQEATPHWVKGKYVGHLGTIISNAIVDGENGPVVFEIRAGPKPRSSKKNPRLRES
jgi:hypothetical protein